MQTRIAAEFSTHPAVQAVEGILRNCVHCGFCLATCPTYQLLGNELDSPRGRIYLVKQLLEGQPVSEKTRLHLDRCLTCRACETTCPSGVTYGRLLDLGRELIEQRAPRPLTERTFRRLLRFGLADRHRFALLARLGRVFRWLACPTRHRQRHRHPSRWSIQCARSCCSRVACSRPCVRP